MKLSEVIKAIEENPRRKFKCVEGRNTYTISASSTFNRIFYNLHAVNCKGNDISDFPIGGFNGNFTLKTDWQEVKQPVTWQEAFEAWLNGKTVFCFLENGKRVEYDQNINFIHAHSLKTGTWYIEY